MVFYHPAGRSRHQWLHAQACHRAHRRHGRSKPLSRCHRLHHRHGERGDAGPISVSPASIQVVVSTTRQFTAAAIYSDGSSMSPEWQPGNSAPAVASVSTVGVREVRSRRSPRAPRPSKRRTATQRHHDDPRDAPVGLDQLSPTSPTVAKGVPVRFTATAIFDDNTARHHRGCHGCRRRLRRR
jgi:hypothetical protein